MRPASRQQGAIILTVALFLLFLLGFMGIALDFGRLFVLKTELQTAMDSCALAAAQELDIFSDQLSRKAAMMRATNAGMAAGNRNKVNFQGVSVGLTASDITFSQQLIGGYLPAEVQTTDRPRYVKCEHIRGGIRPWLLQAMGAFSGNPVYGNNRSVFASATATRAPGQSTCPIPIGLQPKVGGTPSNNYGFMMGEWATVYSSASGGPGLMGWYDLIASNTNAASNILTQLAEPGLCGSKVGDILGAQIKGAKTGLDEVWNYRFGIYKNNDPGPSVNHPDATGYAYTETNWKNAAPQNAYGGLPAAGSDPTAKNFKVKRLTFASFDDTGTNLKSGSQIVFGNNTAMNSFKSLATPGVSVSCPDAVHEHYCYGYNRRIVIVPIINTAATIQDFVCMLMLQPMSGPTVDVQMEYLGRTNDVNSPCTSYGPPGGTGPRVPTLVQ